MDGLDLAVFRSTYCTLEGMAQYDRAMDYDGDGDIDGFDLAQFRVRYGTTLDPI